MTVTSNQVIIRFGQSGQTVRTDTADAVVIRTSKSAVDAVKHSGNCTVDLTGMTTPKALYYQKQLKCLHAKGERACLGGDRKSVV